MDIIGDICYHYNSYYNILLFFKLLMNFSIFVYLCWLYMLIMKYVITIQIPRPRLHHLNASKWEKLKILTPGGKLGPPEKRVFWGRPIFSPSLS